MPQGPVLSDFGAVLFDVDGTLVDSLQMILLGLGDTIENYSGNRPSEDEIRNLIGLPLTEQMRLYAKDEAEIDSLIASAITSMESYSELERVFHAAVETLRLSHERGLKTALVTSKNRAELEPFLHRFSGASWVDTAVCSSDVVHPKPNPESALLACRRLGVSPADSVFIGDSVYDMRCARGAGMKCVAVAYGAAPRERLIEEQPDLLFDSPEMLLGWAQTSFLQTSCREKN